jgi:hypothetical protein
VKGFGCRPVVTYLRALRAGVRKPPRKEPAGRLAGRAETAIAAGDDVVAADEVGLGGDALRSRQRDQARTRFTVDADDVRRPPANGRKAEAPLLAVETRHCEGCDADLRPAHGRAFAARPAGCARIADLLGMTEPKNLVALFEGDPP